MDELLAGFQGSFAVTGDPNDPVRPHPRFVQYKQKREGYGEQEERRKKLLEQQKSSRRNMADLARKIADEEDEEMEDKLEESAQEAMDEGKKIKKTKKFNPYKNQLMLSEWLVDVPSDFEENWLAVVCPVGKRCLVTASRGQTKAYSRTGAFMRRFPSHLPGGCHKLAQHQSYCILDCIYHEILQTFFVLDIMCWRGHPVYDSDTEFRIFWLQSKLSEEGEELASHSKTNPYKFIPLEFVSCKRESITKLLSGEWKLEVDGLLFIHKEAHYSPGLSPLSGWLKPHMVPQVLAIPVSQQFIDCTPTIRKDLSDTTPR